MDNSKKVGGNSSSSTSNSFDHLFGPKDPTSSSSSTTAGLFSTIFPPPSAMRGRDSYPGHQVGSGTYGASDSSRQWNMNKGENKGAASKDKNSIYQNESAEPSYLSSSIYYGGQENYSPRTKCSESNQYFKKNGKDDEPDGSNPDSASRGNWWQGSLYY